MLVAVVGRSCPIGGAWIEQARHISFCWIHIFSSIIDLTGILESLGRKLNGLKR